ncbi:hypothetical protein BDZ45DRAFT_801755 [Acephala macrosclerotiorum]|nr:hypothetical protein BDZ45DRAFT_801755 [Acephala macrosclerotiorum]
MPTTFHCFGNLPTELRLQIWNLALSLFPRIFELTPKIEDGSTETGNYICLPNGSPIPNSKLKVNQSPILLMTSHEARDELLLRYSLSFSWGMTLRFRAFLRFCPDVDILFVDFERHLTSNESLSRVFMDAFGRDYHLFRQSIPSLAGTSRFWYNFLGYDAARRMWEKTTFTNLEEIIVLEKPKPFTTAGHGKVIGFEDMHFDRCNSRPFHGCRLCNEEVEGFVRVQTGARVVFKRAIIESSEY